MTIQEFCDATGCYSAKDSDGDKMWYIEKPHKGIACWVTNVAWGYIPPSIEFPNVPWENSLVTPKQAIKPGQLGYFWDGDEKPKHPRFDYLYGYVGKQFVSIDTTGGRGYVWEHFEPIYEPLPLSIDIGGEA